MLIVTHFVTELMNVGGQVPLAAALFLSWLSRHKKTPARTAGVGEYRQALETGDATHSGGAFDDTLALFQSFLPSPSWLGKEGVFFDLDKNASVIALALEAAQGSVERFVWAYLYFNGRHRDRWGCYIADNYLPDGLYPDSGRTF